MQLPTAGGHNGHCGRLSVVRPSGPGLTDRGLLADQGGLLSTPALDRMEKDARSFCRRCPETALRAKSYTVSEQKQGAASTTLPLPCRYPQNSQSPRF